MASESQVPVLVEHLREDPLVSEADLAATVVVHEAMVDEVGRKRGAAVQALLQRRLLPSSGSIVVREWPSQLQYSIATLTSRYT